ncbi:HIT domain-containing protein [Hazenella sp. IB182357]|uniref:HIT domain-containing protein n=1 Tax=Polycladospora coralii TaxID=2771432 RepID=A0A926NA99_9BACL|nr:HIT domain-containing protein [Polycladospora coralii]MBD1371905.1 HIT domain-containing protein [Polycladospora coralii]
MKNLPTCLGCSIVRGNLPQFTVFENDDVICVLDIDPIHEGHTLILPKHHYAEYTDIPHRIVLSITACITILSNVLQSKFNPEGITLWQNGGVFNDLDSPF